MSQLAKYCLFGLEFEIFEKKKKKEADFALFEEIDVALGASLRKKYNLKNGNILSMCALKCNAAPLPTPPHPGVVTQLLTLWNAVDLCLIDCHV